VGYALRHKNTAQSHNQGGQTHEKILYAGMDVHKENISIACTAEGEEVRHYGTIPNHFTGPVCHCSCKTNTVWTLFRHIWLTIRVKKMQIPDDKIRPAASILLQGWDIRIWINR
jgi:hypothetical protein